MVGRVMFMPFLNRISMGAAAMQPAVQRLIAGIKKQGFQPFIQIDVELEEQTRLLLCVTQQDIAEFADELAAFLSRRPSKLVSGLNNAVRVELYDAAECFFDWIVEGEEGSVSRIELFP